MGWNYKRDFDDIQEKLSHGTVVEQTALEGGSLHSLYKGWVAIYLGSVSYGLPALIGYCI